MKMKSAFCVAEQEVKNHAVTIDQNGEYLFKCDCGSFFKFPGDFTKEDIEAHLELIEVENAGQMTEAAIEQANQEKLENIE